MNRTHLKWIFLYILAPLTITLLALIFQNDEELMVLVQWTILLGGGYYIALYDATNKTIENRSNLLLLAGWCATILLGLLMDIQSAIPILLESLIGLVLGGGLFLFMYVISRQGLGGGDVKFMAIAGLYLGYQSVVPAMLYGSILAAMYAGVMMLFKKISRKDTIPMAPFLYAGMVVAVLFS